jgi:magnesium transporter
MVMANESRATDGAGRVERVDRISQLREIAASSGHLEAAKILADEDEAQVATVLESLSPALAVSTLWAFPEEKRERILGHAPVHQAEQWIRNHAFPAGSIGRLMECSHAVFTPDETATAVVERLRELVRKALISYGYVVDADGRLIGVLVFRELLFAPSDAMVRDVMIRNPYALNAASDVMDSMAKAVLKHYPVYPIIDDDGMLLGLVRGQTLFEQHAFELSAQAGQMVGVESDERMTTSWGQSLRFRQPWLQLNLMTAFAAGAVVAMFQDTIDQVVILAAFLPIVAGQSGNTGCQALAVTLRGMTLGELTPERSRNITMKEMALGLANGALVGVTAAVGMYFYASYQQSPDALRLAGVVFVSLMVACMVSGVSGTLVPRILRQFGADPATASSIFLTTATDIVSMGSLLMLATLFVL